MWGSIILQINVFFVDRNSVLPRFGWNFQAFNIQVSATIGKNFKLLFYLCGILQIF